MEKIKDYLITYLKVLPFFLYLFFFVFLGYQYDVADVPMREWPLTVFSGLAAFLFLGVWVHLVESIF